MDRVADIEESIWAPRFGLKGMIDATVTARFAPLQQVGLRAEAARNSMDAL